MERRTSSLIISLALAVSLSACGDAASTSSNNSDAERFEESEKAVTAEDQAEQSGGSDISIKLFETETWADDYVISFVDEVMLEEVREITGIMDRDITYGDVKNIEQFSYSSWELSAENFKYFTGLKELKLSTYSDNINALANCQKLTSLKIDTIESNKELVDISALGSLPDLASLEIWYCDALSDIRVLADCLNLTSLSVIKCGALTDIADCPNLASLEIIACDALTDITNCPNLLSIDVGGELTTIVNCPNLTSVSISSDLSNKKWTDISTLADCLNLARLYIRNCDELTNIRALASCPNLTSLFIDDCDAITDISASADCLNLTAFCIRDCNAITDISALASCPNLDSLVIYGCNAITDISALADCPNLTSLDIWYCNAITDISALADCPNLTSLEIKGCDNIPGNNTKEVKEALGID